MNLKNILKKMDINDLKWICQKVGVECNSNKSSIIKKLLSPLKKSYNMDISKIRDPVQYSNLIISKIIDGIYDDNLESGRIMAQKYIKQIKNEKVKKTINDNLEEVIANRVRIFMQQDRNLLFNIKPNWNQIYEIKQQIKQGHYNHILYSGFGYNKKFGCILSIQSALNYIVKKYPQINNTNDRKDISKALENYCNKNT